MDKYKIVALFGEAGSGKDYIQKKIMETDFGKNNLSEIISCTTRPPRQYEIDGVHYHFIPSLSHFFDVDHLQKWIEFTPFRNWWYGTSIDNLTLDKINIGVFNISGIRQILDNDDIECLPIKISTLNKIRILRQLNREDNPDCHEIARRFLADEQDFSEIPFEYKLIENNTNEINPILEDITTYIKEKWSI